MLGGVSVIGLAESTSAGPALAGQVTQALSGLGVLSVTTRQVSTEVVGRALPRPGPQPDPQPGPRPDHGV